MPFPDNRIAQMGGVTSLANLTGAAALRNLTAGAPLVYKLDNPKVNWSGIVDNFKLKHWQEWDNDFADAIFTTGPYRSSNSSKNRPTERPQLAFGAGARSVLKDLPQNRNAVKEFAITLGAEGYEKSLFQHYMSGRKGAVHDAFNPLESLQKEMNDVDDKYGNRVENSGVLNELLSRGQMPMVIGRIVNMTPAMCAKIAMASLENFDENFKKASIAVAEGIFLHQTIDVVEAFKCLHENRLKVQRLMVALERDQLGEDAWEVTKALASYLFRKKLFEKIGNVTANPGLAVADLLLLQGTVLTKAVPLIRSAFGGIGRWYKTGSQFNDFCIRFQQAYPIHNRHYNGMANAYFSDPQLLSEFAGS